MRTINKGEAKIHIKITIFNLFTVTVIIIIIIVIFLVRQNANKKTLN